MPSRLFVITGTAGSELSFTSKVFTALGAPCGDEDVFHTAAFERGGTLFWPSNVAGDASWFAAPVLGKLPEKSVVLHQVRHPLTTIQALLEARFFERETPSRDFVQDFLPETKLGGPLVRCMRLWLQWNRMIEAAEDYDDLVYRRFRLEETEDRRVCERLALLGLQRNASSAQKVLDELGGVPGAQPKPLSFDDLPGGRLRLDVVAAAERYGYDIS